MKYSHLLFATFALTLVSLLVCIGLAISGIDSERAANLFELCATTWKLGFGAFIGLIGGKYSAEAKNADG